MCNLQNSERRVKRWLFFIIVLGILLRVYPMQDLNTGSISYNAGLTIVGAKQMTLWDNEFIAPDQAPLRYFVLFFSLLFGREEWLLRLPALIFGIFSLIYIYRLGFLLFNTSIGLLSTFFLSVSLWHIHHSCYIEMYTLYTFLALASVYYFYKFFYDESLKVWFQFIFFSVLGLYAFYPILIIVFVEFLWGFYSARKNKKKLKSLGTALIIFLLLVQDGLFEICQGVQWKSGFGDLKWGWEFQEILPSLLALFGGLRNFLPLNIFIFLGGLGLLFISKADKKKGTYLFSVLLSWILFFSFSLLFLKINVVGRYFLIIYPFFVIISAYGIVKIKYKYIQMILVLVFCCSNFIYLFGYHGFPRCHKYIPYDYLRHYGDHQSMAEYLLKNVKKSDAVVIIHDRGIFAIQYYLDKGNTYPIKHVFTKGKIKEYLRYDGANIKNVFGLQESKDPVILWERIISRYQRMWLVNLNYISEETQHKDLRQWIQQNYNIKTEFDGGKIYLFDSLEQEKYDDMELYNDQNRKKIQSRKYSAKEFFYDENSILNDLESPKVYKEIIYPFQKNIKMNK